MSVLVLGVGNLLMGDEGVGVHAVWRLQREPSLSDVTVVDGGTGGLHLLSSCATTRPSSWSMQRGTASRLER